MTETEEKYRLISENFKDLITLLNNNLVIEFINELSYFNLLGYMNDDILEKSVFELIHPEDRELTKIIFKNIPKKGERSIQHRFKHKDENYLWFETSIRRFFKKADRDGILLISRDITEIKKAEERLNKSMNRYRLITENANDLIAILNDKMEHEYINEKTNLKILGYSKEDLIGKTPINLIHPDNLKDIINIFKKGFEMGEGKGEYRYKRKDGRYIWLESRGITFQDLDGKQKALVISRDISDRKITEHSLKDSEEKFRTIAEQSLVGLAIIQDGMVKFVNEAASKITEYSIREMEGWKTKKFFDHIHQDDRWSSLDLFLRLIEGKINVITSYIIRLVTKSGKIKWIDCYSTLLSYEGSNAILAAFLDITEKKKIEHKLLESEAKWQSVLTNTPAIVIIIDCNGIIKYVNRTVSGFSIERTIGTSIYDYTPQRYHEMIRKKINKSFQTGESGSYEIEGMGNDGTIAWYSTQIGPIKQEGQINVVSLIITDITKRIEIEQKLKESEEKFRLRIKNLGDIIFEVDSRGKFCYISPQIKDFIGYKPEELLNKDSFELVHPEDLEFAKSRMIRALQKGATSNTFEYRLKHKDGFYKTFSVKGGKIGKGEELRLVCSARDVTEQRNTEKALKESQKELLEKRKLAAVGQLAAGVAHELNTPLANLNLTAEYISNILNKQKNNSNKTILLQEMMDIKDQIQFCAKIVKQLLQFSRKMDLNLIKTDIYSLLTEIIKSPSNISKLKEKDIKVTIESEEKFKIYVDRVLLSQVFQNLIDNSIDALENMNGKSTIRITLKKKNNEVEIVFIDNGKGIKESDLSRVFEPFFSTKGVGKGIGLGLAICSGIVEKHGGNISINSVFGKGTEVKVTLALLKNYKKNEKNFE